MGREIRWTISLRNLLRGGLDTAARQVKGFERVVRGAAERIRASFTNIRTVIFGAIGGVLAFAGAARTMWAALQKSFQMERYRAQFAVLLGSVDEAKKRMAELVRFAAETPFELPEIAAASKQLEVLTGGVLGAAESLRLVGDAAAIAGQPIEDVAMWVGRAYDAIKNGRPFGEAAMRLQEMGLLSGKARARIEELQSSGARVAEVWGVLRSELERSEGGMRTLSQTGEGLTSTLRDSMSGAMAKLGDHFQDLAKDKIQMLIDWIGYLSDTKLDGWVDNAVAGLNRVGEATRWVKDRLQDAGATVGGMIGGASFDQAKGFGQQQRDEERQKRQDYDAAKAQQRRADQEAARDRAASEAERQRAREAEDLARAQEQLDQRTKPQPAAPPATTAAPSAVSPADQPSNPEADAAAYQAQVEYEASQRKREYEKADQKRKEEMLLEDERNLRNAAKDAYAGGDMAGFYKFSGQADQKAWDLADLIDQNKPTKARRESSGSYQGDVLRAMAMGTFTGPDRMSHRGRADAFRAKLLPSGLSGAGGLRGATVVRNKSEELLVKIEGHMAAQRKIIERQLGGD